MFTLKIQNAKGELYELTHHTEKYAVLDVQGLTPPKISVNTSSGGVLDGSFFNSARAEPRNIVITLDLRGRIEQNRREVYRIFTLKKPCTVYFKNVNADVRIEGFVEAIESDIFSSREQMQISLICPRVYFEDAQAMLTELSRVLRKWEFPFSVSEPVPIAEINSTPICEVNNLGEAVTGAVFTVEILETITEFTIYSTTTGESFGVHFVFVEGDIITISTIPGQKSVTIRRGDQVVNAINWLTDGSKWLTLELGENIFTYSTSSTYAAARITITSTNLYGGV